jgi:hypothetical protein
VLKSRQWPPHSAWKSFGFLSLGLRLIDLHLQATILAIMKRLIRYIHNALAQHTKRRRDDDLTAVEYEAVCLIAYEGRAAYARARQQAFYCRSQGSDQGFRLWSAVAVEIDRRAGASAKRTDEQSR